MCPAVGSDSAPAFMKNPKVVALTAAVLLGGPFVASLPAEAGACWTAGATNPMGRTGSDKWADAMSQLHSHFRRAPNGQRVPVAGYCKGHVRGFAWRTAANATDQRP